MEIVQGCNLDVDVRRLLRALGDARMQEQMTDTAEWAVDRLHNIIMPKAVLDHFVVEVTTENEVVLKTHDSQRLVPLQIGKMGVRFLKEARYVQVSFATLGDGLQRLNDELAKGRQLIKQYVLDTAAVLALDCLGKIINGYAEKLAADKGWGVGRRLSPGDLFGWELHEQGVLGGLLPVDRIGITIKSSSVLYPLKSASGVVGIGPGYAEKHVRTVCEWCRHQKSCPVYVSSQAVTV